MNATLLEGDLYLIAPLGRGPEEVASHQRLLRPGGSLVLKE